MRAPLAILLLSGGCTIERAVPVERYACESGGPCDAGIIIPGRDARPLDAADPKDAELPDRPEQDGGDRPDGGSPLAACSKIQPLPPNGLAAGDTTNELNSFEATCSAPGGRDVVYGFTSPGTLRELTISTGGSSFDTAIQLYRDDCAPSSVLSCNDEDENGRMPIQSTSLIRLEDVPPGVYALVVDAYGSNEAGTYVLKIDGKLAPGEPCDPAQTFLACELGSCTDDGTGAFRCSEVKDCPDGIDADDDGATDEDVCDDPPAVSCTPVGAPPVGSLVDLSAAVFDAGGVGYRQWRVVEAPFGSFERPSDPNQESTFFYSDLQGPYRIRYRAADDLLQLSACEVAFTTEVTDQLRVELIWNAGGPHHEHHSVLDLHLLHPNANAWFDPTLDCASPDCLNSARDWGQQTEPADDPFLVGLHYGPQWVTVFDPQTDGSYGIGVEYDFDNFIPFTTVQVNVYCAGFLEGTFGPVTLLNGNQLPEDNDFWKVAEVNMNAGDCTVLPYLDNGEPLIITGREAEAAR